METASPARTRLVIDAIDKATIALEAADAAQEVYLLAEVQSKLGYLYYKMKEPTAGADETESNSNKLKQFQHAQKFYQKVFVQAGQVGMDEQAILQWFIEAKSQDLELKKEIMELEKASMSAEERKAHEESEEAIQEAKRRFDENNDKAFIQWLVEKYTPEDKRKPMMSEEAISANKGQVKFARWIIANVSKHMHPDKFSGSSKAKQIEMAEIVTLVNKIVNKLKGLD